LLFGSLLISISKPSQALDLSHLLAHTSLLQNTIEVKFVFSYKMLCVLIILLNHIRLH